MINNEQGAPSTCGVCEKTSNLSVSDVEFATNSQTNSQLYFMATYEEITNVNDEPVTTSFIDSGESQRTSYPHDVLLGRDRIVEQSIIDFMKKPVLVTSGSWTTIQNSGDLLFSVDVTTYLFSTTMWIDKMRGYDLVRGSPNLTVVINASPFMQGRLLLHYVPGASTNHVDYNATLLQMTQHPSVELDCRDSSASLMVPYVAPNLWYSRQNSSICEEFGFFYCHVLSPLAYGTIDMSAANVEYSVYLHWENFELAAPTVPQSMKSTRRRPEDQERIGPSLSSGLRVTRDAANLLAKIPSLTAVMKPAAWVADVARKTTAALGWSKPSNDTPTSTCGRQLMKDMHSSTGEFNGPRLALCGDNRVENTTKMSIRQVDEMSMDFLKTVECLVNRFYMQSIDAPDTILFSRPISPISNWNYEDTSRVRTTTLTVRTRHPVAYVSKNFRFWRGTMIYKFKVVKTQFHTGRISVTFTPGTTTVSIPPTTTSAHYSMQEIVDLALVDEFTIKVPFYSPVPYLLASQIIGQLVVRVLNPLKYPDTASDAIELLVYETYGEDFEVAVPRAYINAGEAVPVLMQSGEWERKENVVDATFSNHGPLSESTAEASLCIGEKFLSIRQLLSRFHIAYSNAAPNVTGSIWWPWNVGALYQNGAGVVSSVSGPMGGDIYNVLAPMYIYYKGGMRVGIKTNVAASMQFSNPADVTPSSSVLRNSVATLTNTGATAWYANTTSYFGAVSSVHTDADVGLLVAELPYYARTPFSKVDRPTSANTVPPQASIPVSALAYTVNGTTFNSLTFLRAVAEDFQFSYFLCSPLEFVSVV